LLNAHGVEHTYREYTRDPLSVQEIRELLQKLDVGPRAVLRARDASKHGIPADLGDEDLIAAMAEHPRLIQRPIGVLGDSAELGRPVENLLRLIS